MAAESGARGRTPAVAGLLCAIVAVALGLRLWGLDRSTLTHEEVYVPRLEMPTWVSAPPPRASLAQTLSGTLHHDNHPPAYYAAMWLWTGAVGTELFALRLPAALAGTLSVALLFALVRPRDGVWTALTAAALLALHGHHLLWSQRARMWVFLGALAVLSLVLLESLARRYRPGVAAAYAAVVAMGLWTEYSFWPFALAQILYEAARRRRETALPATLEWLYLSVVSASPVMYFLMVHLGLSRTGYLARAGLVDHLGGFAMLQWLLRGPPPGEVYGALASVAVLALVAAGAMLLLVGLWPRAGARTEPALAPAEAPARWVGVVAAALPSVAMLAWWTWGQGGAGALLAAALPWGAWWARPLVARGWAPASAGLRALQRRELARRFAGDPVAVHTLVPLAILLALSLAVPSVASRSLLFLTPFALWAVARGIARVFPAPAPRLAVTAALLAAFVVSVVQYTRPGFERWDHRALAEVLRPELAAGDLVLIRDAWYTQPMHYYLPPSRHRTRTYDADIAAEGVRRVWVIVLDAKDAEAWGARATPLRGYAIAQRVASGNAYAVRLAPVAQPRSERADGAPVGSE